MTIVKRIQSKELLNKFEVIQDMDGKTKAMVINFLDLTIGLLFTL